MMHTAAEGVLGRILPCEHSDCLSDEFPGITQMVKMAFALSSNDKEIFCVTTSVSEQLPEPTFAASKSKTCNMTTAISSPSA